MSAEMPAFGRLNLAAKASQPSLIDKYLSEADSSKKFNFAIFMTLKLLFTAN